MSSFQESNCISSVKPELSHNAVQLTPPPHTHTQLTAPYVSAAARLLHLPEGPEQEQAFQGAAEGEPLLHRTAQVQLHGGACGTLQKGSHLHQRAGRQTLPGQGPGRLLIAPLCTRRHAHTHTQTHKSYIEIYVYVHTHTHTHADT